MTERNLICDETTPIRDSEGTEIGSVWFYEGEWHSEHGFTGVSWASESKNDAVDIVLNQHLAFKLSSFDYGVKEYNI